MYSLWNSASLLLLTIILGCDAIYRYSGCVPKECQEDWIFSTISCGCVKDGDEKLGLLGRPSFFPRRFFPFGGAGSIIGINQGNPGGIINLQGNPNPFIIQTQAQQNPFIIQQPQPPARCGGVVFICPGGQVFDENICRCVCQQSAAQLQCSVGQIIDPNTCRCTCPQGAFASCPSFQSFNFQTCRCESQGCPSTCSTCQRQNPTTCACEQLFPACPLPQVQDPNTCQCRCPNNFLQQCNQLQQFDQRTCQCRCVLYIASIEITIPGTQGPPVTIPGGTSVVSRTRTRTATARTPGGRRRTGRAIKDESNAEDAMEGPEMEEVLFREKRRRSRTRTRSRTTTRTTDVVQNPPSIVPGQIGPPTTRIETQQVRVCPGGFQNENTCTCN